MTTTPRDINRVTVGVGTHAIYEFNRMVTRVVCLAGVQSKLEAVTSWKGTITAIRPGEKLPTGKPDYETDVKDDKGVTLTFRRSWVDHCIVLD